MEDNRNQVIEELQKELDFYQQKIKDLDEIVVKKKLVDDAKKKINLYLAICGVIVLFVFGVFAYKEMTMLNSLEKQKDYLEKLLKIEEINLKSYVENKVKEIEEVNQEASAKIADKIEGEYFNKIDEFSASIFEDIELKKKVILTQIESKEKQLLLLGEELDKLKLDLSEELTKLKDEELNKFSDTITKKFNMENDDFKIMLENEKDQVLDEVEDEINSLTDGIEPKINTELNAIIASYDEYITKELNSTEKFKTKIDEGWVYFGELYSAKDKNTWKFRNFMINFTKAKYPAKGNQIVSARDMVNIRESYFDWVLLGGYNEAKIIGKLKKGTKLNVTDVHASENGKHVWVKIENK